MRPIDGELQWFAVRTIFRHEKRRNKGIFEEKITLYRAANAEAALARAEQDAARYLQMNESFVQVKHYGVFSLGSTTNDFDGTEVWSHLCKGSSDPEEFFRERHASFDLGRAD